mmetsp:Transcript_44480/g.112536  ORF Transcript_44480/g.112536 Transcript_44480/m.112536 type:complete len:320 (+) Transcript_44480:108-1067(+)
MASLGSEAHILQLPLPCILRASAVRSMVPIGQWPPLHAARSEVEQYTALGRGVLHTAVQDAAVKYGDITLLQTGNNRRLRFNKAFLLPLAGIPQKVRLRRMRLRQEHSVPHAIFHILQRKEKSVEWLHRYVWVLRARHVYRICMDALPGTPGIGDQAGKFVDHALLADGLPQKGRHPARELLHSCAHLRRGQWEKHVLAIPKNTVHPAAVDAAESVIERHPPRCYVRLGALALLVDELEQFVGRGGRQRARYASAPQRFQHLASHLRLGINDLRREATHRLHTARPASHQLLPLLASQHLGVGRRQLLHYTAQCCRSRM